MLGMATTRTFPGVMPSPEATVTYVSSQAGRGAGSNACPPDVGWGDHQYVWGYGSRLIEVGHLRLSERQSDNWDTVAAHKYSARMRRDLLLGVLGCCRRCTPSRL